MTAYILALSGVLLNTFAQLFLKTGTNQVGVIQLDGAWLATAEKILRVPAFYGGFACYAISLVVWIAALSRLPVSVAYPLLSVGYVINAFLAYWLFGEAITMQKMLGIGFIILGVVLIARN